MLEKFINQLQKQPVIILVMFLISLVGGIITIVLGWNDFYKNYLSLQFPLPVWLILFLPILASIFFLPNPIYRKYPKTKELLTIEGQTFKLEQVVLDGKRFVNCTFDGCELVYRGESDFSLEKNEFKQPSRVQFTSYAGNTLNTMRMLYQEPNLRKIIENSFEY